LTAPSVPWEGAETIVYFGAVAGFHAFEVSVICRGWPASVFADRFSASYPGMIVALVAYPGVLGPPVSLITPVGLTSSRSQYSPGRTLEASTHWNARLASQRSRH